MNRNWMRFAPLRGSKGSIRCEGGNTCCSNVDNNNINITTNTYETASTPVINHDSCSELNKSVATSTDTHLHGCQWCIDEEQTYFCGCHIDKSKLTNDFFCSLSKVDRDRSFLLLFVIVNAIGLFLLHKQKEILLCGVMEEGCVCPTTNFCSYRFFSSALSLIGILYFTNNSKERLCTSLSTVPCNKQTICSNRLDLTSNLLIILAILLRIQATQLDCCSTSNANSSTNTDTTDNTTIDNTTNTTTDNTKEEEQLENELGTDFFPIN